MDLLCFKQIFKSRSALFVVMCLTLQLACPAAASEYADKECIQKYRGFLNSNKYFFEKTGQYPEVDTRLEQVRRVMAEAVARGPENISKEYSIWTQRTEPIGLVTQAHSLQMRFEGQHHWVILNTDIEKYPGKNFVLRTNFMLFRKGKARPAFYLSRDYEILKSCRIIGVNVEMQNYDQTEPTKLVVEALNVDRLSETSDKPDFVTRKNYEYTDVKKDFIDLNGLMGGWMPSIKGGKRQINLGDGLGLIDVDLSVKGKRFAIVSRPNEKVKMKLEAKCTNKKLQNCRIETYFNTGFFEISSDIEPVTEKKWLATSQKEGVLENVPKPTFISKDDMRENKPLKISSKGVLSLPNEQAYWFIIQRSSERTLVKRKMQIFDPSDALPLTAKSPREFTRYLRKTKFIHPDSERIREWKKQFFSDFKGSRYEAVQILLEHLSKWITYERSMFEFGQLTYKTTAETIENGFGICVDFSNVFIAMARALGIPARMVSGVVVEPNRVMTYRNHHAWVEVSLDNKTWVPIEPNPGYPVMELVALYIPLAISSDISEGHAVLSQRARQAFENLGKIKSIDVYSENEVPQDSKN